MTPLSKPFWLWTGAGATKPVAAGAEEGALAGQGPKPYCLTMAVWEGLWLVSAPGHAEVPIVTRSLLEKTLGLQLGIRT